MTTDVREAIRGSRHSRMVLVIVTSWAPQWRMRSTMHDPLKATQEEAASWVRVQPTTSAGPVVSGAV